MSGLNIPESATVIFDRMATDVSNTSQGSLDAFDEQAAINFITTSFANAFFEIYKTIEQAIILTFWDTTFGEDLSRWAAIWGVIINPATQSEGFVTFTGVDSTLIPSATQFSANSGNLYETKANTTITLQIFSQDSLTNIGTLATFSTLNQNPGLATGMIVDISGASQPEYNGSFQIVMVSISSFQYTMGSTPASSAIGASVSSTFANVDSNSLEFGSDQNLLSGTPVSLASPIPGVDNQGFVSFDELGGGSDIETQEDFRDRFLFRIQQPISSFNAAAIIAKARTVAGVTRVFVQTNDSIVDSIDYLSLTRDGQIATFETSTPHGLFDGQIVSISGANEILFNVQGATILFLSANKFIYIMDDSGPLIATGIVEASFGISTPGQIRVFFLRDNDVDPIPTPSEVDEVKDALLEIKPAYFQETNLIVEAPIPVQTDYIFSQITPNTQDMKDSILNNLTAYYSSGTSVAKDVTKKDYDSVLTSTFDSTGNKLTYNLSTPNVDIDIGPSEVGTLGTVTFP